MTFDLEKALIVDTVVIVSYGVEFLNERFVVQIIAVEPSVEILKYLEDFRIGPNKTGEGGGEAYVCGVEDIGQEEVEE